MTKVTEKNAELSDLLKEAKHLKLAVESIRSNACEIDIIQE